MISLTLLCDNYFQIPCMVLKQSLLLRRTSPLIQLSQTLIIWQHHMFNIPDLIIQTLLINHELCLQKYVRLFYNKHLTSGFVIFKHYQEYRREFPRQEKSPVPYLMLFVGLTYVHMLISSMTPSFSHIHFMQYQNSWKGCCW